MGPDGAGGSTEAAGYIFCSFSVGKFPARTLTRSLVCSSTSSTKHPFHRLSYSDMIAAMSKTGTHMYANAELKRIHFLLVVVVD